jgi:signal transduction protein with GAF and PtsI domain
MTTPNPGSDEARTHGCTCPVIDMELQRKRIAELERERDEAMASERAAVIAYMRTLHASSRLVITLARDIERGEHAKVAVPSDARKDEREKGAE